MKKRSQSNYKFGFSMLKSCLLILLTALLLLACKDTGDQKTDDHAKTEKKFTCPMHAEVMLDHPGTCPVCGMSLVEVTSTQASGSELMLSDTQVRLANITAEQVGMQTVGEAVVINGTLRVDEKRSEVISTRAAGRIEKLYVKETGKMIKKGAPLYVLYSESLLTLQREYLLAKEQHQALGGTDKKYASFLEASTRKLLLYGLTPEQIENLTAQNSLVSRVTIVSPASGIITEINATEGDYFPEGGILYRIEDIASLWVEAELYPSERALVNRGDKITVKVTGFKSAPIEATVNFITPEYRANSQITTIRADIKNPGLQYLPGQQAQVLLTHSSTQALAIPVNAVIRGENGMHVYVRTSKNTFEPRVVRTGLEGPEFIEIKAGLYEGDTVVVTGAYLLYSEIVLKQGTDPMAAHNH